MPRMIRSILVLGAMLSSVTVALGDTHPFSVHDMLAMDRISDPQVSPDGSLVVFVVRETDLEADRGRTDLWLIDIDGSHLRRLTSHPASDGNARWMPDGSAILFLSGRSGSSQVWRIPVDGGEAQQVTHQPLDVGNLLISPKGKHIAFTMDVFIDCKTPADTKARLDEIAGRKSTGRIYDGLFIRHWDTWKDGRRSHLFSMALNQGDDERVLDVMRGMDADTPAKPFGGPGEITFTPDGSGLVFTARVAGREEAWSTNFDLFAVPTDRSSRPRCLTKSNPAWDTNPVFSPDGKTLAYRAMKRAGYESDRMRIVLRNWRTGQIRVLTEDWDRSAGSITWSSDGGTLYTTASNLGQRSLFAIDAETGEARVVVEQGNVGSVGVAGDRILYGLDHLQSPVELNTVAPDGKDARAITHINDETVAAARMGDFEQFTFAGWKGETVHGYVVKPVDFDPKQKYPVAFLIHGGPQGSFGNHFHYRWNPQAYAGAGYAAVMVDFHGSTGYGQAFCDSIRGDWGGKPLVDLQKGLAAALDQYKWMNPRRVSALGASFGGYMINWIEGNWSDRFRCLVNHDGNLDERMAYFDTEELWFPEWDHRGTPWDNPSGYEAHNPINFVKNWKTPMLVIHGGRDYRVVDTQGMSTFTVLQRLGIPSRFLYYPDESHWVLKPANSIQWHETVIAWLDRWTKRD
ncbi:MAG: prolyl oligopeptidase family serine peptidase [Phycisphaerae bacterium]